jgi:hypothetical protein
MMMVGFPVVAIGIVVLLFGWMIGSLAMMEIGGWIAVASAIIGPGAGFLMGRFAYTAPPIKTLRKW